MMKKLFKFSLFLFALSIFNVSCSDDDSAPAPTTGTVKGIVTDASDGHVLANVRIIVFDANTNSPSGKTILTGNDGAYSIQLTPGSYYLKLSKQGYQDIPVAGISPVPFTVELDKVTTNDYQMSASSVVNGGSITGKAMAGGNPVVGALVFATAETNSYSTVTDSEGNYFIYNVPAGSYKVKGYKADYNSSESDVTVTANNESSSINITMTAGANGSISGSVTFVAATNGEVDVTLTHPVTNETIPGLVTKTSGGNYSLNKVPDGTYIARASYENDGYVVDPDWIIKNGEPSVTITGNNVDLDFNVTGAVSVTSPTNEASTTKPIEITETTPVFNWQAYSGTSDYVIEVSDINGNVIWGGFTKSGSTITKNIVISKSQLSIAFNSDGTAKSALQKGVTYRWKIYASKDDNKETTGWKLISVSEEQRGLFIIK